MKKRKWLVLAILLAAALLVVVACGGADEAAAPAPTEPAPAPTNTPVPPTDTPVPPTDTPIPPTDTAEPSDEPSEDAGDGLNLADLASPDQMDSYRSVMTISMEGSDNGGVIEGSIQLVVEHTSNPPAQHIVMSAEGIEGAEQFGNIEMYVVEDTMYIQLGEQWMSTPVEGDPLADMALPSSEELLDDTCGWERQADTEIDGAKVEHWSITKASLEECPAGQDLLEIGDLSDLNGDLYISVEENYVVRMDMLFEGTNLDMGLGAADDAMDTGRIQVTMELVDVNEPFSIELPPEAESDSGLPADIPVPDDAEQVSSMMGMITFESASEPAVISEFYQSEMPSQDWEEVSAEEVAGMYMLEYSKEGRSANIMISHDEDTGKTSVLLTVVEE